MFSTIASINEYTRTSTRAAFVRWSTDIAADVRRGYSINHQTGAHELGISVNPLTSDLFSGTAYIAQQVREYIYLAIGTGAQPYILTGEIVGHGADNEPVIADVQVIGMITQSAIDEAAEISADAQTQRIMQYAEMYADRLPVYGRKAYVKLVAQGAGVWVEDVKKVIG